MAMSKAAQRVRYLVRAVSLVWASARGWTALQAVAVAVQGVLPVATLYLTRQLVNAIGSFMAQTGAGVQPVLRLLPWVAGVAVVGWIFRALSSLVVDAQAEAVSDHVQDALQQKSAQVDLAYYETSAYHDQLKLAQSEAGSRPVSIVQNLTQLASGALILGSVAGVLLIFQGVLLPLLLVAALPGAAVRVWNSRRWHAWRIAQSPSERQAGYLHLLLTTFPFAKEIRLLGTAEELRRRFGRIRQQLRRSRLALIQRRVGAEVLANALSAVLILGGMGIIYLRMRGAAMTLGDLALLYGGFQKGRGAFSAVLGSLAALYEDSLFIDHFYTFLALPERVRSPEKPRPMPRRIEQGLRLEHVTFRYPGGSQDVLRDLNLDIRAGEHLALVGENGSGKTTLVKLLCRLYDPTAGRILLDGVDIREFDLPQWRRLFSVLFQDFVRYQMSVAENIRMGDLAVPDNDERIRAAAAAAGAAELVQRLPRAYATPLGRLFAGGQELSEGQWQRIALARAFLRDAPVLMLDEPTSSLDPKAERELLESVITGSKGRTVIIVSHRLTTVQAADRIVVLADGQLVESGTHAELLRTGKAYPGLFALHSRTAWAT